MTSLFVSDFRQLPYLYFLEFSHSLSTAAFASGLFMNKFVHKIIMAQSIDSSSCNVAFMIFLLSFSYVLSRKFVGFNDACVFCLASIKSATSFLELLLLSIVSWNSTTAGSMK